MAHLYKASEWEDGAGHWHVADVQDLAHNSAVWWLPARLLNIPLVDFILKLKEEFHAEIHYFPENSFMFFYWKDYNDAHKYLLWINRMARHGNWTI